jgi:hypothetical protein
MHISFEGYVSIGLALLGLAGAGAIMVFPNRIEIGWALILLAVTGVVALVIFQISNKLPIRSPIILVGMLVCLIGFLGLATVYFWPVPKSEPSPEPPSALRDLPDLLSLFMADFKPGIGLVWNAFGDIDVATGDQKQSVRIYYKIISDTQSNTKFLAFYVPLVGESPFKALLAFLAKEYASYFDIEQKHWAIVGQQGSSDQTNTQRLAFSGRIYIYHNDSMGAEEVGVSTRLFREHGASVQFRGDEYLAAVWSSIQSGAVKPPLKFVIRDGIPVAENKDRPPNPQRVPVPGDR